MAQRGSMNIELYTWHLLPNDLEQPCGFTLWQASFGIADFNQTYCADFDILNLKKGVKMVKRRVRKTVGEQDVQTGGGDVSITHGIRA